MVPDTTINWLRSGVSVAVLVALCAGCAGDPGMRYAKQRDKALERQRQEQRDGLPVSSEQDSIARVLAADNRARDAYRRVSRQQQQSAYRQGVEDTMAEFRGRMNATENFVWQKPIVDVVRMPSRVVNGALVPAHKEPVLIAPGEWEARNGVALPNSTYEGLQSSRAVQGGLK